MKPDKKEAKKLKESMEQTKKETEKLRELLKERALDIDLFF
jgi:hypothetical protein